MEVTLAGGLKVTLIPREMQKVYKCVCVCDTSGLSAYFMGGQILEGIIILQE